MDHDVLAGDDLRAGDLEAEVVLIGTGDEDVLGDHSFLEKKPDDRLPEKPRSAGDENLLPREKPFV